jgi:hypothetical protein
MIACATLRLVAQALQRVTRLVRSDPAVYVAVLAAAYPIALLAAQVWPDTELFPGVEVMEAVMGVLAAAGVVLWLLCREWSGSVAVRSLVGLVLMLWTLVMILELTRGSFAPSRTSLVLGLSMALVLAKPPGPDAALRAMGAFAWALLAVAAISIALESLGLAVAWSQTADDFGRGAFERDSYWLPISHLLGLDGRWAGPFGHPNRAGPVAALLIVLGSSRRGWSSWVLAASGLVMLALSASRTSEFAALAGVVTLLAAPWILRGSRPDRAAKGLVPAVLAGVLLLILAPALLPAGSGTASGSGQYVASALTGTGRTSIWPEYVALWRGSPWVGVGSEGIGAALQSGRLPLWATHAHNTFLDAAARYGSGVLLLFLAVMGLALVVTVGAARRGRPAGLAVVAVVVVNGLGHTVIGFVFPEVALWALVLAVMMSAPPSPSGSPTVEDGATHTGARERRTDDG